jgi:opacity protein-like surface antigen
MRWLGIAAACVLLALSAPAGAAAPSAVVGSGSADGSGWGGRRGLGTTGQSAAVGRVRMFLQVVDNPERSGTTRSRSH